MQAPLQARNDSEAAQTDIARTQKRVLADNRPEAVAQRKLAEMMNNGPRALQQRALSNAIHSSPRMVAQRHAMNALFGRAVKPQEGSALPAEALPAQSEEKTNNTGLPNQLKSGIESLSGMSMNHVKVHYNSDKPAQFQAHAYAQGNEIHLGTGQEKHLPHEAWHVVQQAQGRVRPTLQMKAGAVNNDPSLENEADMMGARAAQSEGGQVARNLVAEERAAGVVTQRVAGFSPRAKDRVGRAASRPTVQLTTYKHDGTQWVSQSSSSTDTDPHPAPSVAYPNASLGDTYDQQTGAYTSPVRDELTRIGQSSGAIGFYDRRATTGYRYASGKRHQGPHSLAHISKRVAMGAMEGVGRDPLDLVGSRAFPRPRRMNKMMRDRLRTRGANWAAETRKERPQYLKAYRRAYFDTVRKKKRSERLNALRKGIELNPATVNNIGAGTTSASQIAGKGENRQRGAEDWLNYLDDADPTAMETMDLSGATALEQEEAGMQVDAFGNLLHRGYVSEDDGDSESDSDISDLDDV